MPHFDQYGGDSWICQVCAKVKDSRVHSEWRPDITGNKSAGNVCPDCLKAHTTKTLPVVPNFTIRVNGGYKFAYTFREAMDKAKRYGSSAVITKYRGEAL